MNSDIFLGLGSNIGNRERNLLRARDLLECEIVGQSSFYETEPVDYLDQAWFVNLVIQVNYSLTPQDLLERCLQIEKLMGRVREVPKGPRVIDVDILFFGDRIVRTPDLTIPHPAIPMRRFVLQPMADIAPAFVHPELHRTIQDLLASCPDSSAVRKLKM